MAFKEELERLFDLPFPYAMKEVESKLLGTYVKINGTLVVFSGIADTYLSMMDEGMLKTIYKSKVVSLEAWLPETGVYQNNNGLVCFIYKKPIRQWKRSFSMDFYIVNFLTRQFPLQEIVDRKKETIWVDTNRIIHYFTIPIGYVKDCLTVVCTNKLFEQEILDWRNNE